MTSFASPPAHFYHSFLDSPVNGRSLDPDSSSTDFTSPNFHKQKALKRKKSRKGRQPLEDTPLLFETPKLYEGSKIVYYMRHAATKQDEHVRSIFSCCFPTTEIRDPPLSEAGVRQTRVLRERIIHDNLLPNTEIVFTSPSARCAQTAVEVFHGSVIPIEVCDMHREVTDSIKDCGTSPTELQKRFPVLDFHHISEEWWIPPSRNRAQSDSGMVLPEGIDDVEQRVVEFTKYLLARKEKFICVIGHLNFLRNLIRADAADLPPCDILTLRLDLSGRFRLQ